MTTSYQKQLKNVALENISREKSLTDFSLSPVPEELITSIRGIGMNHPPVLAQDGEGYQIITGHRRIAICRLENQDQIDAYVLEISLEPTAAIHFNLIDNLQHRAYSDIEKASILKKLDTSDATEEKIIKEYMPLLGLQRSKKLFLDYLKIKPLPTKLRQLLHDLRVPARVWSILGNWQEESLNAVEKVFTVLKPGVNKWRDLLELVDDLTQIEKRTAANIFNEETIQSILAMNDLQSHEKYDRIHNILDKRRNPIMSDLQKKVAILLDEMTLGPQTKIRAMDSFEEGEIRIEIRVRDQERLISEIEKLDHSARSDAMNKLIELFKMPS
jgi:hypothetical protein